MGQWIGANYGPKKERSAVAKGAWKRGDFAGSAANWKAGYTNAGPALQKGIAAPRRDPTAAAIAAKDAMVAGFNRAVTDGTWAANLQKAGQGAWQSGMAAYAQQGLASKANKGASHYGAFAQSYGSAIMGQVGSLPPRGPAGSNQARSAQINDWAHSQKGKFKRAWSGS
jgi:hypothetical protein